MADRCSIPRCRGEIEIVYLDHGVCTFHWNRYTSDTQPADALARALGVSMAVDAAQMEIVMAEKKTKKAAKPKAAAEAKTKREKQSDANRVFAIRVTDAELAAIHKASGPRNATRFIRSLAAAFANEDHDAFKTLVAEARKLRA